jgi:Leucine-rich repeat (LRR) protein
MNILIKFSLLFLVITQTVISQVKNEKLIEYNSIEEALKNPEKVYNLNLSNQNFELSNEDWSKFINLEYLTLENDHLKEFPIGITKLKSLKTINLSGNDFKNLPPAFSNLINLEEIFLNNEKNINLPVTLSILSKLPKLKSLHLENDNLMSLPIEIQDFKNLESLFLNQNKFKEIPKIESLDHLKYLDLKGNNIDPNVLEIKNLNFGFKINL